MNFEASEKIDELAKALVAFAKKGIQVFKTSKNPQYRSSYVPLEEIIAATSGPLAEVGLVITQFVVTNDGLPFLATILVHESGQWMRGYYPLNGFRTQAGGGIIADPTPQGIGIATTYARRYSWFAVLGMAGEPDDDGNTASGVKTDQTKPAAKFAMPVKSPRMTQMDGAAPKPALVGEEPAKPVGWTEVMEVASKKKLIPTMMAARAAKKTPQEALDEINKIAEDTVIN